MRVRRRFLMVFAVLLVSFAAFGAEHSFLGDLGYAEDEPLYFGNPSDAVERVSSEKNYLMIKPQFTLSYNAANLGPNWVAWHLSRSDLGSVSRNNSFRPDEELPLDWYAVKKSDYQFSRYGFERGHLCPSADRTATVYDNSMTFLMTNMVPQSPDSNRYAWNELEMYERALAMQGNELYIFAGVFGSGGGSDAGVFSSIPVMDGNEERFVNVPAFLWKILLIIPEGIDDLERVDDTAQVIAVWMPNQNKISRSWKKFCVTIDYIEQKTGYDFFELLPDDVEDLLESRGSVFKR